MLSLQHLEGWTFTITEIELSRFIRILALPTLQPLVASIFAETSRTGETTIRFFTSRIEINRHNR
jgi:hypothetical protein